jgi:hypothetical protein
MELNGVTLIIEMVPLIVITMRDVENLDALYVMEAAVFRNQLNKNVIINTLN